jgi:rhomboid protease GluP
MRSYIAADPKSLESLSNQEVLEIHELSQFQVEENWLTRKPDSMASLITLTSILMIVFVSAVYWNNYFDLSQYLIASPDSVFKNHEYWRAWTSFMVHADEKHLLGNLFLFYIFGFFLAGYFGVVVFPLTAFFVGGIINLIVLWKMPLSATLVGVSGVVFWMGGVWLVLYFLIETRKTFFQRIIRSIGVGLVLFMPSEAFDPSVSYKAHFVGFVLGILCGVLIYFKNFSAIRSAEINRIEFENP